MRLALYEPDIPQNTGAMLRLAACLGVGVDVIEPCGFLWNDRHMRRAGMDYLAAVDLARHPSWAQFLADRTAGRLVLLTTKASVPYHRFAFAGDDTLILGRESAGVPALVHEAAAARVRIPLRPGQRSFNVAQAAAIVLSEALRQTDRLPSDDRMAENCPGETTP